MSVSLNTNVTQVANTQPVKPSETKTDDKSKFLTPTQTKVAIGTGLAALAAVGIYLATRGRSAKPAENVINDVTQNAQETANTIKEMTVDTFKQGGNKFVKGKAITSTGESFTGSITHQTKDGKNIVSEYENGLIKKSTKYDGENILSQKEYNYNENGQLRSVFNGTGLNSKLLYSSEIKDGCKTVQTPKCMYVLDVENGNRLGRLRIKGQYEKFFKYDENGVIKGIEHDYTDKHGIYQHDKISYDSNGNKKVLLKDSGEVTFYNQNGAKTDSIRMSLGDDSVTHGDFSYYKCLSVGAEERKFICNTKDDVQCFVTQKFDTLKGHNEKCKYMQLTYPNGEEYMVVLKAGQEPFISRTVGGKQELVKDSNEVKNILKQTDSLMTEIYAKHEKAKNLRQLAYDNLKDSGLV